MQKESKITINENIFFKESQLSSLKVLSHNGQGDYRILYKEKCYDLTILGEDYKSISVKINGYKMNALTEDDLDQLVNQLGFNKSALREQKEIIAPMPGLVLKVLVNEGVEVHKGENLFILEAMKMENIIKSVGEGKLLKINVKQGDKVEKGQVLARF